MNLRLSPWGGGWGGGGGGGGGGVGRGGIYPNLLSPTHVIFILYFQLLDHGSLPWTLSRFRAHHIRSTGMVNLTSQFIRTRLDATLRAYECKHANSYIQFFHGSCTVIFHRNMISCHATVMLTHQFHMH